ncbi:tetratricopeptide repeat protein [candidate division KSB1 bacterium]|nr:tetratricopeptide repeat protein [candidate division KSB1 bacterium]RQW02319.1 MAG: hypothetical protein EH222_13830 [candidate division KSB1 bacterium]
MSRKSYRSVLVSLAVMLIGLFMLCAHKQTIVTPGEDLSGANDEYRQEILEMLDLANDGQDTAMFAATDDPEDESVDETVFSAPADEESEMTSDDEAELLALLANLEEDEATMYSPAEQNSIAAEPAHVSAGVVAYRELLSEVERLETILERRSVQVDSLRRIIDNRNARLLELQSDVTLAAATAPSFSSSSEPLIFRSYNPIQVESGPFADKYNEARRQFESYDYNGCIATMGALLQENPNHPLADNAQYWIGESYYGLKQYQKAVLEFQKVFAYTAPDKYDDAQLMIGLSYARLGQSEMARSTFGEFLDTYQGSEYAGVAKRYYHNI